MEDVCWKMKEQSYSNRVFREQQFVTTNVTLL